MLEDVFKRLDCLDCYVGMLMDGVNWKSPPPQFREAMDKYARNTPVPTVVQPPAPTIRIVVDPSKSMTDLEAQVHNLQQAVDALTQELHDHSRHQ